MATLDIQFNRLISRMRFIMIARCRLIPPARFILFLPKFQSKIPIWSFVACSGIMTATVGSKSEAPRAHTRLFNPFKFTFTASCTAPAKDYDYFVINKMDDDFDLANSIKRAKQKISAHFMLDIFRRMYKSGNDITLEFMQEVFEAVGIEDSRVAVHLFNIMDRNNDGVLQENEITVVFTLFSSGSDIQRFKFLFRCLDLDGNGVVDKQEFRATLSALLEAQYHLTGLNDLFDHDELFSNISVDEYHTVAKYKANGIVRDIFVVADTNRDGVLSLKEFLHWCRTGNKHVQLLNNALESGIHALRNE